MPRGRFPHNYWKGVPGQEHARAIVGGLIRELGLENASPPIIHQRLTRAEFLERGLANMLMRVYKGSKFAAIQDYLQALSSNMGVLNHPGEASTPRPTQSHRLSLRFLGGVEIRIDGVRVTALERPGLSRSLLCLLAIYRYGLRPIQLLALLSSEYFPSNFPSNAGPPEIAPVRPIGTRLARGAALEPSQPSQSLQEHEPGQVLTITATTQPTEATALAMAEATVTHKVRQMVYRIRQAAGWHDIVVSQAEGGIGETIYSLPDDTQCDIWDFRDKLAEADWHSSWPNDLKRAEFVFMLRKQAIQSYSGELGCEMDDVAAIGQEAIRLHETYLGALLNQATFCERLALRNWESRTAGTVRDVNQEEAWRHALGYYMQAVRGDRYDESAYVGAMRCHARLGNWVKVQQVFDSCQQVLSAELGKAPSRLTTDAYRELGMLCGEQLHGTGRIGGTGERKVLDAQELYKEAIEVPEE